MTMISFFVDGDFFSFTLSASRTAMTVLFAHSDLFLVVASTILAARKRC